MCGRYSLTRLPESEVLVSQEGDLLTWSPRYNIAPSNLCPVKSMHEPDMLRLYRWGLVPFWAKDEKIGFKLINARAETLTEKPSFRNAFAKNRCLVYADSFYEWKTEGKEKQPYRIQVDDGKVFMMAGLTEFWKSPEGKPVFSFTIITTSPNELMGKVHDRMPVILDDAAAGYWLDPGLSAGDAQSLLSPFPADAMSMVPVEKAVGNVRNDYPFDEVKGKSF
ncbi:MAG: SOS response-associated peptidase [Bacteroidia bacterium]